MSNESGKLIVIDGGEGAGKTCGMIRLKEVLPEGRFEFMREPGNTDVGEGIRNILLNPDLEMGALTELLLFWAARAENVEKQIRPILQSGRHIICDRFDSTTWAYQIRGRQREDLAPLFEHISRCVLGGLEPDLYVYLELPLAIGRQRAKDRGKLNRLDKQEDGFYERAYPGYREFIQGKPHLIVDASQSFEAVSGELLSAVESVVGPITQSVL
ncbi:MAG: dTMP kinase [Patescibacteria group bacterium]